VQLGEQGSQDTTKNMLKKDVELGVVVGRGVYITLPRLGTYTYTWDSEVLMAGYGDWRGKWNWRDGVIRRNCFS